MHIWESNLGLAKADKDSTTEPQQQGSKFGSAQGLLPQADVQGPMASREQEEDILHSFYHLSYSSPAVAGTPHVYSARVFQPVPQVKRRGFPPKII